MCIGWLPRAVLAQCLSFLCVDDVLESLCVSREFAEATRHSGGAVEVQGELDTALTIVSRVRPTSLIATPYAYWFSRPQIERVGDWKWLQHLACSLHLDVRDLGWATSLICLKSLTLRAMRHIDVQALSAFQILARLKINELFHDDLRHLPVSLTHLHVAFRDPETVGSCVPDRAAPLSSDHLLRLLNLTELEVQADMHVRDVNRLTKLPRLDKLKMRNVLGHESLEDAQLISLQCACISDTTAHSLSKLTLLREYACEIDPTQIVDCTVEKSCLLTEILNMTRLTTLALNRRAAPIRAFLAALCEGMLTLLRDLELDCHGDFVPFHVGADDNDERHNARTAKFANLRHLQTLRRLHIGVPGANARLLADPLLVVPDLRILSLTHGLQVRELITIARAFPKLEDLSVDLDVKSDFAVVGRLAFQKLTQLHTLQIRPSVLRRILNLQICPQLRTVRFNESVLLELRRRLRQLCITLLTPATSDLFS
jgi:hypothetical protein